MFPKAFPSSVIHSLFFIFNFHVKISPVLVMENEMILEELKKVIKTESDCLEFKSTTGEIYKACKTLCAFLNNHGGLVLIGVKDDGRLVGQMVTDATRQEIANELRKFEPPVFVKVNYIPVTEEKCVIAMKVPAGEHVPYTYDGRPYHRVESSTSIMPQHLYEQFLIKRGQLNHDWDEFISDEYTVEDLDQNEISLLVKRGIEAGRISNEASNENIIEALSGLKLIENGKIKNAAVVLFAKKIPLYSQCMIKMARFRGLSETEDFVDNQQFYGNAFKIMEEANIFIRKHLSIASFYQSDSFERIDKPTLPVLAVREAIINAICHKDYSQRSAAITLAIFDDRMEIWNNGILPRQITVEDLKKKHRSYPRNKLIANAFYMRGLIETWGTGTTKMLETCRSHGIPEPMFEEYSGGVSVQFMFAEPIQRVGSSVMKQKSPTENLSRRQQEIVYILEKSKELKSPEILEQLMEKPLERTFRKDLAALKKLGIINSRGRGRHAVWFKL